MTPHPAEEILMVYADDPSTLTDVAGVEAHVDRCDECAATVDDYRLIMAVQRQQETWWASREVAGGPTLHVIERFVERMQAEDAEARRILEPFLESVYKFSSANVASKRRFFTGGVVRLLCAAARDQCDRTPLFALALAQAAIAIAEALPEDHYPARAVYELRGTAWKEYSTACRYLGRFEEGWKALDRAEEAYRKLAPGSRLATVSLARASLLYKQEHYAEALPYARHASAEFAYLHEQQRYFDAKQVEATILRLMGDPSGAGAAYEAMLMQAEATGDAEMKGRAAQNLGVVYLESGNLSRAGYYFSTALQVFEMLELDARAARARWGIGTVALASGQFADAVRRLSTARAQLLSFGMTSDAHLAALHLAEALLMLGRWNEVHTLSTELVAFFRNSDMITGALTAASFLKEAAAARTLTRKQIGHVREYLEALERKPKLAFAPPPPE
jgi:tetratricopeptide (TPR) repeat protein